MNILMVLESDFPPDIRVENEIACLHKLGHRITIACLSLKKDRATEEDTYFGKIIRKKISTFKRKTSVAALKFPFYFHFWKRYLSEVLKSEQFDALHIHDLPLSKVGEVMQKKHGIPLVVDLHENWPAMLKDAKHTNTFLGKLLSSNSQWEKYESSVLHAADAIITVVEEMKERILKFRLNSDRIFVIPNYMNLESEEKQLLPVSSSRGRKLLYAGGINQERGLQVAIQGMALLPEGYDDVSLIIAGFGSYENDLKQLTNKLDLPSNKVRFLGKKTQTEIFDLMKECDIMLIPHLRSIQTDNSSPNKLFQYMYYGKPVLCSDCRSLKRIVNKEKVGVIYENDNPNDFVSKLIELINTNAENFMGKNGVDAVQNRYNWGENIQVLDKLYRNFGIE